MLQRLTDDYTEKKPKTHALGIDKSIDYQVEARNGIHPILQVEAEI